MQRTLILVFGILAYLVFLPTFLYLIAFVGNLQTTALAGSIPLLAELVPYSISFGRDTGPMAAAVVINLALIALFGLQHSIMARSGFKAWLKKGLPPAAERSVYVLLASVVLIVLFWQWRPLGQVIWQVDAGIGQALLWALFAAGFGIVFVATFLIDHFDLFGLRQVWFNFTGKQDQPPKFVTPLFYRWVRHPLYFGFLLAFWAAPLMTLGHLLFAAGMTAYILIALVFEERDLAAFHGGDYRRYQQQVPKLIPVPGRSWKGGGPAAPEPGTRSDF